MDTVLVSFIIIISSGQQPTNSQNEGTENSQDGIVKGDSHEKDRCPSSMDITIADDTESETTGSDKHKFVEEMMSRQSHGCPGPPGFQTDLPRSNVTTFSRHRTILQTEVQTPSISRPSNPQGIQGGLFDSNEIQCSMQIIYPPTVPNLQNYPSSSVPMRSNPFYGQDSISKEQQYLELPYRQTGRLLSGVQEQSVPEQDQLISDNNYNQQRKVQGVQAEYDDHEKDLLKSNKREKEKQAVTSEHIKDENGKQSEKRVKFSEDVKIDKSEDSCKDLKDFIKQYVKQEIGSKRSDIKRLCDAVIVYDKNDYEYAFDMKDEIKAMVTKELNEELRIELFDDEKFMQSHVQVVQDVLKNASVVLVYLSNNTGNSRQVQFFIEEAIALTRIGPVDKDGLVSDCEFSVRPVHSQASYKRNYRTPPGLASVSGIDWFDKSKYTYDRIIAIMKNAIRRRKLIENPRQVQDEFRQTMLRTGSMTHQQFHRRNAPQHAWDAGTSAFTTSGPRYTPQATTEPLYRGMNDPTQHGFNISDAESMLRRMSIEPNQGSAASSYTKSGEHFLRSGEEYSQPEYRYVYANVNPSFTPYSEPVEPFGVQQNRAFGPDLGYRTAEEAEFCGCHRIGQFSRIVEQSRFLGHNQMPLNEEPQYRRDGGDEKHVMGLVNDGQKTNTSRTNIRSADGYDATNQPRTRHSAMQQAPGAQRQRPTEYTPRHMQQKTLQQQQKQSRGQMGSGRGIITSEMLISNLSTNDVEIDNPTSTQESRRTYDQGPAVNVYTEETDSSEDELWDPLGNLPGSKGGRVVNIVGSKVLQIGNQNSVTNVGNIVKKDRKQSKEMKAQDKDNESYEDEPKKHLAEFNKNTESDSKPDIRSKDIKHPSNTERLSQKLGNETKQSNVAKSGNDLSDSVNLVCKHNENQKTYDHVEQPAKDVVSGYELNIPLEEPRVHANTDAKGVKDVERYIYDENTRLTATVSYPDLQKMPRSHWSQKIIAGEGHFMTTDGGPSVLLLKSSPNAIDHTHPPVFTNTMTDAHLNSLDENTEVQKLDDYAWTEAYNEETRMFTSNDLSDADLFGYGIMKLS